MDAPTDLEPTVLHLPVHRPHLPTLWLDPGPGRVPDRLLGALQGAAHLVAVPRTGSSRAEVALLLDPDPGVLALLRRLLPAARLLALPGREPGAALLTGCRRTGTVLLPVAASVGDVVRAVTTHPAYGQVA